jgi:ADP-ribosylglycohydrolase
MIGAIAGDVIGSRFEGGLPRDKEFELFHDECRFTDDTVMTVAVAHVLRTGADYAKTLRHWGRQYPNAGYGGNFLRWVHGTIDGPYNSFGNGSAMRVSAVAWARDDLDAVVEEAARSAAITHDHPEGVKGAQATAAAVLLGRQGAPKDTIVASFRDRFGYDVSRSVADFRERATFDVTCQGTLPAVAAAFGESTSYEDAVRLAVSMGGDTDTLACITGAVAEAHYGGVPESIRRETLRRLDRALRAEVEAFIEVFPIDRSAS